MKSRDIIRIVHGVPTVDGAGVNLVRVLGASTATLFDPFLMLDAFDSRNPADYVQGFPMHPHRGIETLTYLIRGRVEHRDSLGNAGRIEDGSCQWMTAGSGILHEEMPRPCEHLLGLQLWINLPARAKMSKPKYRDLAAAMIPEVRELRARVRVVAGRYKGLRGPVDEEGANLRVLDITLQAGARLAVDTRPGDTVFACILEGACCFGNCDDPVPTKLGLLFSDGDEVTMEAGPQGARLVLFSGTPLREPVAWGGSIVMNTEEEVKHALQQMEEGTFIRSHAAATDSWTPAH